jgi:hypothetical protein
MTKKTKASGKDAGLVAMIQINWATFRGTFGSRAFYLIILHIYTITKRCVLLSHRQIVLSYSDPIDYFV